MTARALFVAVVLALLGACPGSRPAAVGPALTVTTTPDAAADAAVEDATPDTPKRATVVDTSDGMDAGASGAPVIYDTICDGKPLAHGCS